MSLCLFDGHAFARFAAVNCGPHLVRDGGLFETACCWLMVRKAKNLCFPNSLMGV
jgi:hypothetical protein